jgi:hypothetical protein
MDYCGVAQIEGLFEMNGLNSPRSLKAGIEFIAGDGGASSVRVRKVPGMSEPKKGK